MIPVKEPYRAAGCIEIRSILVILILGTVSAILMAGLIWLWEISPIPTLVLLTAIIHGIGIGLVLAFIVGRLAMRHPRLVAVIGFGSGLLSIGLVHYGHHLAFVQGAQREIRRIFSERQDLTAGQREALLAEFDKAPSTYVDPFLVSETGYRGFLGTMMLRNRQGVTIKSARVSGWFLWILWGGEALFVAIAAASMASSRASEPFCEDCGDWCRKAPDVLVLPGTSAEPLVEAIRDDDPGRLVALRGEEADDQDAAGSGHAGVTLHACPHCDQTFADVWHRIKKGKDVKMTTRLSRIRISPEMVAAIVPGPPSPADEPDVSVPVEVPPREAGGGLEGP